MQKKNNGVEGKPNMTLCSFYNWINADLLKALRLTLSFLERLD